MQAILNLLIVPFIVLFVVLAIPFAILAYKRGAIRAAISLAASIIAIVLAVVIAKVLAPSIGSPVAEKVLALVTEKLSATAYGSYLTGKTVTTLVSGIAVAVTALPVFLVLETVLLLLIKIVSSAILKKKIALPESKGLQIGGAVIGVIDALVVAFFVLLPVYGTADAAIQIGSALDADSASENKIVSTVKSIVDPLSDNAIVKIYGNGLSRSVYNSLTTVKTEKNSVTLVSLGSTAMEFVQIATAAPAEDSNSTSTVTSVVNTAVKKMHEDPVYREIFVGALDDMMASVPTNNTGSESSTQSVSEILGEVKEEDKEKEATAITNVMAAYANVQAASNESAKFEAAVEMMEAAIEHPNVEPEQVVAYIESVVPAAEEGSSNIVAVLNDSTFKDKLETNLEAVQSGAIDASAAKSDLMAYYYAYVSGR